MNAVGYDIRRAIVRLECSSCGAEASASCDCAKPYIPARAAAAAAVKANPEKSNRAIAADIGVSDDTVARARRVAGATPDEVIGRDGKRYPARANTFSVLNSSRSAEWYTPPDIIELATNVLGGIDLDPCWHPESCVRAATTHVAEQDGLSREWRGRVYLNPPYGRAIDAWIEKLITEHDAGRVSEAVALVPARVDTEWFRRLDAFPRCFLYGRLTFANAENPAPFPCAVVYLGGDVAKFAAAFGQVGGVWVRLAEGGAHAS